MSLNKFFDVNTGYDIGCDIGADEIQCNNINLSTINGNVYPNNNILNELVLNFVPVSGINTEGGSIGDVLTIKSMLNTNQDGTNKLGIFGLAITFNNIQTTYATNYSSFQFNVGFNGGATYETLQGSASALIYDGSNWHEGSVIIGPSGISSNPLRLTCYFQGTNQSAVNVNRILYVSCYLQYNRLFPPT